MVLGNVLELTKGGSGTKAENPFTSFA